MWDAASISRLNSMQATATSSTYGSITVWSVSKNTICSHLGVGIVVKVFEVALSRAQLFETLQTCSSPGSSARGIHQARILEWVAISSSRGPSWPRDRTSISWVFCIGRQILYHCTPWEAQHQGHLNAKKPFINLSFLSPQVPKHFWVGKTKKLFQVVLCILL